MSGRGGGEEESGRWQTPTPHTWAAVSPRPFRSYAPILVTAPQSEECGSFLTLRCTPAARSRQQTHWSVRCRLGVHVQGMSYKSRHIQGCSMARWPLSPRGPREENTRATVAVFAVNTAVLQCRWWGSVALDVHAHVCECARNSPLHSLNQELTTLKCCPGKLFHL